MADYHNAYARIGKAFENNSKLRFELCIKPFFRLVQKKNIRIYKQQLRQRRTLLLPAGQIIRMTILHA